ncbi:MAG TPA: T9SS type A sorting domain-containing protein, partial [Cyclobacteriaceae bacterium]|nr:T9SS type A sorting domain-containing protein [Cyclobacteriaceae bacterium]
TRQSGCVYSTSKNVSIYDGPLASFTTSALAGGAPLTITFTNTSSNADSSLWQFGDASQSQSTNGSPTFTYTQLGTYKPALTAFNRLFGCKDTTSVEINVVIPHIDLAMINLSLVPDPATSSTRAEVTILNSGNIPITNPEVLINLAGSAMLKENVVAVLQPGNSVQQMLSLEILPQSLSYICVEVAEQNDVNKLNDKQCLSMTSDDVLLLPYPNPASDQIHFDWIGSTTEDVRVIIYRSNGEVAFLQDFQHVQSGINRLTISTSSLAGGLYLIQFSGAKTKKAFRFIVSN